MQCCRNFGYATWTCGSPVEPVDILLHPVSDLRPSQEMRTVRELSGRVLAADKNVEMEIYKRRR
jgi:hypothetical protein